MLIRQEADAIYDAGRETVVHVLLEMSRRIEQLSDEWRLVISRLNQIFR